MLTFGTSAFRNCINLTSLTLPQGLTTLGRGTFMGCTGLTSIAIPNSVTSLSIQVFNNCSNLQSVTFGNGITAIGNTAFNNCSRCMLFDFRQATSVPTLNNINVFSGTSASKKIVVPDALYNDWIAASNWSSTTNGIVDAITRASDYTA